MVYLLGQYYYLPKEIKIDKYLCLIWHSSYCLKGKMEGLALRKTGKVKQGKTNIY
jgi:hypothetical protein